MRSHNKFLCRYPTNDAPLFYGRGISLAGQKVKQDHNKEQGSDHVLEQVQTISANEKKSCTGDRNYLGTNSSSYKKYSK